ncbi:hypothetical protein BDP27DRAFT_1430693 [Rhodocollybia butyracea]|uniref:Uncharacterized protein n=1 Tax=Rhodocollybia butyracea TaxID=206335 RepID=A0A9P5P6S7_9AGAR|nr:hypothetical protein BDP27DRAFT_1430693 [Rhodocollybia butyracea]
MSNDVLLSQLSELTLNHSVFDQVSPLNNDDIKHLFADVEYIDDDGDNDQSDEDQSLIEDIASAFTNYSTPHSTGTRPATTFPTAKKWLAAWLKIANLYHCAVTLNPIAPNRMNQMAHIMLPQSAPPNAVKLTSRVLAMSLKEMCIHSRLFFMPLRSDVHSLVDMHRAILLVNKDILKILTQYLQRPLVDIERESEWSQLRKGSLSEFTALKDGTIYECTLLCSPHFTDQPPLNNGGQALFTRPYANFPPIRTHVTPFALAFHALRVLESTTSPMKFDFEHVFRARSYQDMAAIKESLERALLGIGDDKVILNVLPPEINDHTRAFMDFVVAFDRRCFLARAFMDQKPSKPLHQTGGSSSHRRGSVNDSSHYSRHSRRSHPDPPSTPTPAPSIHSQTKNRTNVRPTAASEVREEYLAALSLSSLTPHDPPSHAPMSLFADATKPITQSVLDSASNPPPLSVSSGPLADLPISPSEPISSPEPHIVASARPYLVRRLIRAASRWMRDRQSTIAVKRDNQIAIGPNASWTPARPARLATAKE